MTSPGRGVCRAARCHPPPAPLASASPHRAAIYFPNHKISEILPESSANFLPRFCPSDSTCPASERASERERKRGGGKCSGPCLVLGDEVHEAYRRRRRRRLRARRHLVPGHCPAAAVFSFLFLFFSSPPRSTSCRCCRSV